tara:strand:- start:512 stop:745 length:234 start_codon:yes stop_codon:yes gene_type:complete
MSEVVENGRIELSHSGTETKHYLEKYKYVDGAVRLVDEDNNIVISIHRHEIPKVVEYLIDCYQARLKTDAMKVFESR